MPVYPGALPPPHKHLVTYHGVLSSAAAWRKEIVPGGQGAASQAEPAPPEPPAEAQPELAAQRPRRLLWAQLLQRTFGLDVLQCPKSPHALRPRGPTRHQAQTSWEFVDPP